jgi:hypothetical protein
VLKEYEFTRIRNPDRRNIAGILKLGPLYMLRPWCRWFERLTMTVILVNCVTLGMYEPCPAEKELVCDRNCQILKVNRQD